jgi:hypothetical protein
MGIRIIIMGRVVMRTRISIAIYSDYFHQNQNPSY